MWMISENFDPDWKYIRKRTSLKSEVLGPQRSRNVITPEIWPVGGVGSVGTRPTVGIPIGCQNEHMFVIWMVYEMNTIARDTT